MNASVTTMGACRCQDEGESGSARSLRVVRPRLELLRRRLTTPQHELRYVGLRSDMDPDQRELHNSLEESFVAVGMDRKHANHVAHFLAAFHG